MQIRPPFTVTRSHVQHLVAGPDEVFPLLCPVREVEWAKGWDPVLVMTESGVVEPGCVFITRAQPNDAIWYVSRHEPQRHFVEMIKVTPGVTVCRLTIQVDPAPEGSRARVTYSHTSLGPRGDAFVEAFTEAHFEQFMHDWEAQLNRYLARAA